MSIRPKYDKQKQRLSGQEVTVTIFRWRSYLLGITKLDKEKNQCIREKTGEQNIVKEIKQYQKK